MWKCFSMEKSVSFQIAHLVLINPSEKCKIMSLKLYSQEEAHIRPTVKGASHIETDWLWYVYIYCTHFRYDTKWMSRDMQRRQLLRSFETQYHSSECIGMAYWRFDFPKTHSPETEGTLWIELRVVTIKTSYTTIIWTLPIPLLMNTGQLRM